MTRRPFPPCFAPSPPLATAKRPIFPGVLWLASRRMQRTGSTAILTTRLTPAVADAAIALSRMGSKMRFTLVTAGEPSEEEAQLLHLLFASGLETAHIRAA